MFENLKILYGQYGGISKIFRSSYFWIAAILTILSYDAIKSEEWTKLTFSIIPSLSGFTIAAFALIFAILDEDLRKKLTPINENGSSPIASVTSAISHAVVIQISSLLIASVLSLSDFSQILSHLKFFINNNSLIDKAIYITTLILSTIGTLFTYYGILLVVAAILSIMRMQIIISKNKS